MAVERVQRRGGRCAGRVRGGAAVQLDTSGAGVLFVVLQEGARPGAGGH